MRRSDREVTAAAEIAEIMSRCEVVRIAIHNAPAPYILPLNFGMEPDGMTLYFHGAKEGTKYTLLEQNNCVSFEMDCVHGLVLDETDHSCTVDYESVIGWGYVEDLEDIQEKRHALRLLMKQYHAEAFPVDEAPIHRTRVLRLRVHSRTAKRRRKML